MPDHFRIEPLAAGHNRSRFSSGVAPLDQYLIERASQDVKRRVATCFVAADIVTGAIAGYYTLAATSVALADLPIDVAKKLPRYPQVPGALVGRLAVDRHYRGMGLGGQLLTDAILRAARAELGIFVIVVDAKDDNARDFYAHHGFTTLDFGGHRMFLQIPLALRLADAIR